MPTVWGRGPPRANEDASGVCDYFLLRPFVPAAPKDARPNR